MRGRGLGALLVLGGLFIGLGVGLYIDEAAAGILTGLGVGLVAAFIAGLSRKRPKFKGKRPGLMRKR